uniref:Uncharacterized protein n=1 Tax=mine drainage metagenome TaxID=410659 RepID=E6PQG5_9ZZZZ
MRFLAGEIALEIPLAPPPPPPPQAASKLTKAHAAMTRTTTFRVCMIFLPAFFGNCLSNCSHANLRLIILIICCSFIKIVGGSTEKSLRILALSFKFWACVARGMQRDAKSGARHRARRKSLGRWP